MYKNNSEHPFEVFITNLGEYNEGIFNGEWVSFPVTKEKIDEVLQRIDIGKPRGDGSVYEEYFITDFEDNIADGTLASIVGEYPSLNELNYLANRIDGEMDNEEQKLFMAIMESEGCSSIQEAINITWNVEHYNLMPEIEDDVDLGRAVVEGYDIPEWLKSYIDFEALGRDESLNQNGSYTEFGYLTCENGNMVKSYSGDLDDIPEEYCLSHRNEAVELEENVPKM